MYDRIHGRISTALSGMAMLMLAAMTAATPPAITIHYGPQVLQYGRLHLPAGAGPHPLLLLLHGGCWQARIADHDYLEPLADALAARGWAVWNVEYRSADVAGGGWPGTYQDVAAAADFTRTLASRYRLDLQRLVFAGHSAGGHLALWAGSRDRIADSSVLHAAAPVLPARVIGLASITDLADFSAHGGACAQAIPQMKRAATLAEVSPAQMVPTSMPVTLISVADDAVIPASQASAYRRAVRLAGAMVTLRTLPAGGHFAAVATRGAGWQMLMEELAQVAAPR